MHKVVTRFRLFSALFLCAVLPAGAQNLDDQLREVGGRYAQAYTLPLVDALGLNLNAGLFHQPSRAPRGTRFSMYLGVQTMAAFMPERAQQFDLQYETPIEVTYTYRGGSVPVTFTGLAPATVTVTDAPTIFGRTRAAVAVARIDHDTTVVYQGRTVPVTIDTSLSITTIGGLVETRLAPLAVPQLELGTVLGTDLMLRFVPEVTVPDWGSLRLIGGGLRHNFSAYLPELPVDVSLLAVWQQARVLDDEGEDVAELATFAGALHVGKAVGPLYLSGAFQTESATLDVQYAFTPPAAAAGVSSASIPVAFSSEARTRSRALIGAALNLSILHFSAEAAFGRYTVLSAGLGFRF